MDKAGEIAERMRSEIESIGADFIDLVSYGNGKGVVIAKYPDEATMDAASDLAKQAFAKMIEEGVLKNPSVDTIFGQHVFPDLEVGKVGFKSGLYMASADEIFEVEDSPIMTMYGKDSNKGILVA